MDETGEVGEDGELNSGATDGTGRIGGGAPSPLPSDALWRIAWQAAADAMLLCNADGIVLAANSAYLRLFDCREQDIVGNGFETFLPEEYRAEARELYRELIRNYTGPITLEAKLRRKDGTDRILEAHLRLVEDGGNRLLLTTLRDVTAGRHADERHRLREEQLRAIFNNTREAIIISDAEGIIIEANAAASEILKVPPQQLIGMRGLDFIKPVHAAEFEESVQRFLREGEMAGVIEIMRPDGQTRWLEFSATANILPGYSISVLQDITERLANEWQLERQASYQARLLQQLAEAQEVERRRLSRDIHDGPLQSLGVALLALDRAVRRLRRGEYDVATNEMQAMRVVLGDTVHELRAVLADLSQELLTAYGIQVALQNYVGRFSELTGIEVELQTRLDNRLPDRFEVLIYRVVQESLANIRKHSQATCAHVTLEDSSAGLTLTISDNGVGFDMSKVRQSYGEGSKLGLRSMRERTELAGGTITITSEPGHGTTLVFHFPDLHTPATLLTKAQ